MGSLDPGILPNGSSYDLEKIKDAIRRGTMYMPWIECNTDSSSNSQLYQIYMCVNKSGSGLIHCPVLPRFGSHHSKSKCQSQKRISEVPLPQRILESIKDFSFYADNEPPLCSLLQAMYIYGKIMNAPKCMSKI